MKIQVIDTPIAANPWDADVAELIAATDANTEPGKVVIGGIEVPAAEANKARVAFAKAANNAGKTAKLHSKLDELVADEQGNVTILFSLTKKHNARRGKAKAAEATTAEVTEVTAEVDQTAEVAETPSEDSPAPAPRNRRR